MAARIMAARYTSVII